ncbi:hypothetical protein [Cupriavidus basilensis]
MQRRKFLLTALALAAPLPAMAAAIPVKLYKNPNCYCCDLYAKHLEENGFKVELINTTDMAVDEERYNVTEKSSRAAIPRSSRVDVVEAGPGTVRPADAEGAPGDPGHCLARHAGRRAWACPEQSRGR